MKKSTLKILIPIIIWISILVIIGLSINKRWGDHWGYTIPLAFLMLSFREVLKFGKDIKENSAPPTNRDKDIKITKEDIEGDLHEGRD
jgi:hypothetical protein